LYFSIDAGNTFTAGPELRPIRDYYDYSVLASPVPSTILMGHGTAPGQLIASFDRGAHWTVVYRAKPSFLGFTTAAQGVGIVQSPVGATALIMTFDGGRRWSRVSF
jgi:hypothetical protein